MHSSTTPDEWPASDDVLSHEAKQHIATENADRTVREEQEERAVQNTDPEEDP